MAAVMFLFFFPANFRCNLLQAPRKHIFWTEYWPCFDFNREVVSNKRPMKM